MMMNCRQATRLMSEALDRRLSVGERLALRLHNSMCSGCTHYRQHMHLLRTVSEHVKQGRIQDND